MKWTSLIVGVIIIIGGVWFLLKPTSADSPTVGAPETQIEQTSEGKVFEDGTLDAGVVVDTKSTIDNEQTAQQPGSVEPVVEEEPVADPIFHALVEYTSSGFSPKTVTINKGETVRFTGQTNLWPASANHPTHTLYPEKSANDCLGTSFDACRVLKAGEFWEFTFNEVGSWNYHNHVRATDVGTIIVK